MFTETDSSAGANGPRRLCIYRHVAPMAQVPMLFNLRFGVCVNILLIVLRLTQGAVFSSTNKETSFEKRGSFKVPDVCSDAIYRINAEVLPKIKTEV